MVLTLIASFLGSSISLGTLIFLLFIALIGGICITTIGPGGIFVTIALFVLLPLSPGAVAGTASATFIATGIAGSLGYLQSGELNNWDAVKAAIVLGLTSIAGSYIGSEVNKLMDGSAFALVLGGFVIFIGCIILYRQYNTLAQEKRLNIGSLKGLIWMGIVGLLVGFPGGMLGLGGPVFAVPLLVVLGAPMLLSVALAQVQSVFISGMATVGYALQGVIQWKLAFLLVIPLLIGTVSGWYIAQRIPVKRLKVALAFVLVGLGFYLILGGAPPPS